MTKDKVIFYLRRCFKRCEVPSQEELAKKGFDYEERQKIEKEREALLEEATAISIAIDLVQNARSDNLVFKD